MEKKFNSGGIGRIMGQMIAYSIAAIIFVLLLFVIMWLVKIGIELVF